MDVSSQGEQGKHKKLAFAEIDQKLQEIDDGKKCGSKWKKSLLNSLGGVLHVLDSLALSFSSISENLEQREIEAVVKKEVFENELNEALKLETAVYETLERIRNCSNEKCKSVDSLTRTDENVKKIKLLQSECKLLSLKLAQKNLQISDLQSRIRYSFVGLSFFLFALLPGLNFLLHASVAKQPA